MKDFSYITNSHPSFIEGLYKDFTEDPQKVDPDFRKFFEGFDYAVAGDLAVTGTGSVDANQLSKEFSVYRLIEAYRHKGHLIAQTNPIRSRKDRHANLELKYFGLTDKDLTEKFQAGQFIGLPSGSLQQIIDKLKKLYCGSVGVECGYITDPEIYTWLIDQVEKKFLEVPSLDKRKRNLEKINQGVIFEKFLHTKYIGQKRFSLEGGEALIPALDAIIHEATNDNVDEAVIGMAHRGRLNVLANTLGKTYEQIFSEFEGVIPADKTQGSGDVKYHLGFRSDFITASGKKINLQLCPNPSHLEVVDPVALGFARAKANVLYNFNYNKILPILIHGDAAVAGQGIIYEVAQMSELEGYNVGGTIHLVINNQIGFTTDYKDARSSDYCTAIAGITKSPVFHVNGDDIEAVVKAAEIATVFRQKFHKDIYIDILCYRRHGHNEGDEPKFTQPHLYSLIDKHPNPREVYMDFLTNNGEKDAQQLAKEMETKFWNDLQERFDEVHQKPLPYKLQAPEQWWQKLRYAEAADFQQSPVTGITETSVHDLMDKILSWPEDFQPLRKIKKLLQDKKALFDKDGLIDWGTAELLAYASLLIEELTVRLSGEDVKRGTFAQRHAVLFDENTNLEYNRLNHLSENQRSEFRVYNSLLSEYAVLGFEYGYALANPNNLAVWEAQYGDFANGAQMVIDQYISSAESKWGLMSGVVLLLPHGYEGSGPDHSSARLERYLQSCAEYNMVVTNITTAGNFFHALRRQMKWDFRKPLINMSPKANLRHPGSYSKSEDFAGQHRFQEVIDDAQAAGNPAQIKKVLLCSGKLYFDLEEKRQKENRTDIALIRLEQIYPTPEQQLVALHEKYSGAVWFWVQEEPQNMGAATFLQTTFKAFPYGIISRNASASTATGYAKVHKVEQEEILETAFNL
ncbi:2-oxoglutarate dehydrogenase E1 component [Arachidicoccus rhizosphaerae]|uniref:oxoglutarate dehydrogenase (succinyl-transferring) n=1 Tax=Arachidicoccus rhizosphaerae TaxID=551991 RepID=A0A1H4B5H8_9BACT|nr:2-oxoglutarate dehydrogenase E1 component [Arachidicoccus rhizosphaerae]SEA43525.1 2-oxoglutarate dehydrogenase E1 component [Arachidicoccus rhizosphaerae]